MASSAFKFTMPSILMIAGGAVALLMAFMPQAGASATFLGQTISSSVNGLQTPGGMVAALAAAVAIGAGAAFAYAKPRYNIAWLVGAIAAAVGLVFMLLNFMGFSRATSTPSLPGGLNNPVVGVNAGISIFFWLAVAGLVVALIGALMGRMETAKATGGMGATSYSPPASNYDQAPTYGAPQTGAPTAPPAADPMADRPNQ